MFGKRIATPRLIAWFGDPGCVYRYSGIEHKAHGWPAPLTSLKKDISIRFGASVNFVLLNFYRDGDDYMGWHSDDEPEMKDPVISLSLGCDRDILVRRYEEKSAKRILLRHGSLFVHDCQLKHSIPKRKNVKEKRVSMSFRSISADGNLCKGL